MLLGCVHCPDHIHSGPHTAGLGVFILNMQSSPTQSIFINARISACYSVLMAEAASLALVTLVVQSMNIANCTFLSDFRTVNNLFISSIWRIQAILRTGESSPSHRFSTIIQDQGIIQSSRLTDRSTRQLTS
jgi:hypothetical protein